MKVSRCESEKVSQDKGVPFPISALTPVPAGLFVGSLVDWTGEPYALYPSRLKGDTL